MSPEVREKVINLFYNGLTPTEALENLKESSENYWQDSKDRSKIPNLEDLYYLFDKEKAIQFGSQDVDEISIDGLKKGFNGFLNYCKVDGSFIIAWCTPLMIATISENILSKQIFCIDSSGGMDRTSGHLFNLCVPGPNGSLSIGMFVSFSEKSLDISTGLKLLQEIWLKNSGRKYSPTAIMSDHSNAQINALKENFPNSLILLCQFHILQALWKWLQSNVMLSLRQNIINSFKSIMYTKNEIKYGESKADFLKSLKDEKTKAHFIKIFRDEKMFACVFRKDLNLNNVNTNNLIERSFLQIKNKYLDRNKVFNAIQLIQKISENYEISTKIKLKAKGPELKQSAERIAKAQLSDFVIMIQQPERNCITDLANFDSVNEQTLNYISDLTNFESINYQTLNYIPNLDNLDSMNDQTIDFIPEIDCLSQPDNYSATQQSENGQLQLDNVSDNQKIDKFLEESAIEKLKELGKIPECKSVLERFYKRLCQAKTTSAQVTVVATGGCVNRNILKTQSRIKKIASKNRFKDLRVKKVSEKQHNLAANIKKNVRNKATQSKK